MSNLVKCPTPRNFKTGKISLSHSEASDVQSGNYKKLIIMKFGSPGEVVVSKSITESMIDTFEDKGDYVLMSYR